MMNLTKCEFTEKVSFLIDGELTPAEAAALHYHLSSCVECQEARADFLNLRREIEDYRLDLSPVLQDRVLAEILSDGVRNPGSRISPGIVPVRAGWREQIAAAFRIPRFGAAFMTALALVLLLGVGFLIYRNAHPSRPDHPPVIAVSTPAPSPVRDQSPEKPETPPMPDKNEQPLVATRDGFKHRRGAATPLLSGSKVESVPPLVEIAGANSERPADTEALTARHTEQSGLLLLAFRNARAGDDADLSHEKSRARQLLYQNIVLRREATDSGDMSTASLLDSLEPILIDIANLPDRVSAEEVQAIKGRIERKSLVPLLQVNSTELARLND